MATQYQMLLQERTDLRKEGQEILAAAERTPEQDDRLSKITGRVEALNAQIEAEELARDVLREVPAQGSTARPVSRGMNDLIRQAAGKA